MLTMLSLQEIAQEVGSQTVPPFTLRLMGKSVVSVSFLALITFGLVFKAVWHASRGDVANRDRAQSTINASLFWGTFTFAVAFLHTLIGLTVTALSVRAAGTLQPDAHWLVATGIAAPLLASVYGLFVFLLAALVWFGFRKWLAKAKA